MVKRMLRKLKPHLGISLSRSDQDAMARESLERSLMLTNVKQVGSEISFKYLSRDLAARLYPHSDTNVAVQVLVNQEYRPAVDFFQVNFPERSHMRIIDAGANVGYSSVFFASSFHSTELACVEPDDGNVSVLRRNLSGLIEAGRVRIFRNGLMNVSNRDIMTKSDFRDGRDWSITVGESNEATDLKSICVEDILRQMNWESVDLIKIDIEGSERAVFEDSRCLNFLEKTTSIAVEIHDEFDCRDLIYGRLKEAGFVIFNFAETTFAVKREELTSR